MAGEGKAYSTKVRTVFPDWAHGQVPVPSAGDAQQLPDIVVPDGCQVTIIAKTGNTGIVYLGRSKLEAEDPLQRFDGLIAGLAHSLKVENANLVWVDVDNNGEGVSWSVEQVA
jgi:hypothetical protein